jgi:CMP-N,N'-diacetyllegionaminic acid synthase
MIAGMRVVGIIPARAGSKGIPGKNTRLLKGEPLVAHAIKSALGTELLDRVVVTTESEEIARIARSYGAETPFMRPEHLATDEAAMRDVLVHAVETLESQGETIDIVVLLQPTAPLRKPAHVSQALELLVETGADSVVSVVEVPLHYVPHFVMKIESDRLRFFLREGEKVTRRQDAPRAYSRNGTVYATRRDVLIDQKSIYGEDCRPMIMEHSDSVNLDTEEDWEEAEAALGGNGSEKS